MKKKKWFVREYSEVFAYLRESKNFIVFVIGFFLLSAVIGYFISPPEGIYTRLIDYMREMVGLVQGKSLPEMIIFLFMNNVKSSFFGLLFGVLFGVFPVIATFINGYFLGFVSNLTIRSEGVFVLWRILPHGIFELPAVFISFGLGIKLGTFIFQEKSREAFVDYLWNSIRVFLLVILPLLIIAAIIEGILIFYASG